MHRQYHHHRMTFSLMYAFSENFVLPISHDEVVHGKGSLLRKMPGDRWNQLANLRAFLAYMWAHPGKQLLFMGSEFGQEPSGPRVAASTGGCSTSPCTPASTARHRPQPRLPGLPRAVGARPRPGGLRVGRRNDSLHNVFSFVRRDAADNPLVCVVNFSGSPHEGYRVGLPSAGEWRELLNTDAEAYGGSGVGNLGVVQAEPEPWHGMAASARLRVPPLGAVWLTPQR